MDVCIKIIERLDMFETKDASRTKKERGAVLVFLPGEQGPDSKERFYIWKLIIKSELGQIST